MIPQLDHRQATAWNFHCWNSSGLRCCEFEIYSPNIRGWEVQPATAEDLRSSSRPVWLEFPHVAFLRFTCVATVISAVGDFVFSRLRFIRCIFTSELLNILVPPFPQIDIIGAMMIVWRVRGKIIGSVLCSIVCNNCAH